MSFGEDELIKLTEKLSMHIDATFSSNMSDFDLDGVADTLKTEPGSPFLEPPQTYQKRRAGTVMIHFKLVNFDHTNLNTKILLNFYRLLDITAVL